MKKNRSKKSRVRVPLMSQTAAKNRQGWRVGTLVPDGYYWAKSGWVQKENPLSQLRQKIEERKRRKLVKMEAHISQDPDFRHNSFRLINIME